MLALVEPLVPRDNGQSLAARAPQWLVTAEALAGLGVVADPAEPVELELRRPGGEYWELAPRDDERLAFEPDVPVELSAGDDVAGRDPVLTAALGRAPR